MNLKMAVMVSMAGRGIGSGSFFAAGGFDNHDNGSESPVHFSAALVGSLHRPTCRGPCGRSGHSNRSIY